jgi:glycosyltransferase involved in cell wall biosynthesis
MKVTVIVITYNHARFIAQALNSVLMQETQFPFEVIVSEDCSTDATRDIIIDFKERYPSRIRLLLSERNLNTNHVLTRGIEAAQGDYIALLDGDDYWTSPHKLQKQVDFLDARPDCATCFHNVSVVYEDRTIEPHPFHMKRPNYYLSTAVPKPTSTLADIAGGNFMQTCSVVFRSGLLRDIPGWYTTFPIGDWPLHILNAEHGNIGYIDEILAAYRVHSGGVWSSNMALYRKVDDVENMIGMYEVINRYLNFRYEEKIRQRLTPLYDKAMRLLYDKRSYRQASRYARKYWLNLPLRQRLQETFVIKVILRAVLAGFIVSSETT